MRDQHLAHPSITRFNGHIVGPPITIHMMPEVSRMYRAFSLVFLSGQARGFTMQGLTCPIKSRGRIREQSCSPVTSELENKSCLMMMESRCCAADVLRRVIVEMTWNGERPVVPACRHVRHWSLQPGTRVGPHAAFLFHHRQSFLRTCAASARAQSTPTGADFGTIQFGAAGPLVARSTLAVLKYF